MGFAYLALKNDHRNGQPFWPPYRLRYQVCPGRMQSKFQAISCDHTSSSLNGHEGCQKKLFIPKSSFEFKNLAYASQLAELGKTKIERVGCLEDYLLFLTVHELITYQWGLSA